MALVGLSDRLYYLPHADYADRPVLSYLRGDRFSICVDAGNSQSHVSAFYRALESQGLPLPVMTVLTHWHWDHTFGMHAVNGLTAASRATNDKLLSVKNWEWTDTAMRARLDSGEEIEFCDTCIRQEYAELRLINVVPANIVFQDHLVLDLGGIVCEAFEIDAPHSFGSVVVCAPSEHALIIGDADCGDYYENGGKHDAVKLRKLLSFLEVRSADTVLLGHSEPMRVSALIQELLEEGE